MQVCNSACCNDTATEHLMCERLFIDDLVHWAVNYRVRTRFAAAAVSLIANPTLRSAACCNHHCLSPFCQPYTYIHYLG